MLCATSQTTPTASGAERPETNRRYFLSGLAGAAFAGAALAAAQPVDARSVPKRDDAELLRLCAKFEANMRQQNAIYCWQAWGKGGSPQGPGYIEDDDERDAALAVLDAPTSDMIVVMLEHPPTTLAGFRALARCLLLSASDLRDVVSGDTHELGFLGFSDGEWGITVSLLRGLTGGAISDASCMDVPARFVPDVAGAA